MRWLSCFAVGASLTAAFMAKADSDALPLTSSGESASPAATLDEDLGLPEAERPPLEPDPNILPELPATDSPNDPYYGNSIGPGAPQIRRLPVDPVAPIGPRYRTIYNGPAPYAAPLPAGPDVYHGGVPIDGPGCLPPPACGPKRHRGLIKTWLHDSHGFSRDCHKPHCGILSRIHHDCVGFDDCARKSHCAPPCAPPAPCGPCGEPDRCHRHIKLPSLCLPKIHLPKICVKKPSCPPPCAAAPICPPPCPEKKCHGGLFSKLKSHWHHKHDSCDECHRPRGGETIVYGGSPVIVSPAPAQPTYGQPYAPPAYAPRSYDVYSPATPVYPINPTPATSSPAPEQRDSVEPGDEAPRPPMGHDVKTRPTLLRRQS